MSKKKTVTIKRVKKLLDISEPAISIITKIANEEGISFKAKAQQVIEKYAKNQ
jgi:uncharacterized protein YunC (DUF1805 family)